MNQSFKLRLSKILLLPLLLAVGLQQACAFSLLGPLATWMDQMRGFQPTSADQPGGPMNIGEDYRWNIPVVTYGYSPAFLTFFGSDGVRNVDQAVQIINDLPPASQIDLTKYPLNTTRVNYQASALYLTDLKSTTLSYLLNQLGLLAPEYYVWCVRDHVDYNNTPYFFVIQRNFDPTTYNPSSYINGTLYTYTIFHQTAPTHYAYTIPTPVDPLAPVGTTVAYGRASVGYGLFYTGLTRDDVAGLKYIYRRSNYHVENAYANATSLAGPTTAGGGGWSIVNLTNSSVVGVANYTAGWGIVNVTNANTNGVNNAATGGVATTTNVVVNTVLRGGVEKINLIKVNYDSLLGQFVSITNISITNVWTDQFVSNSLPYQQTLQRVINAPDILFTTQDLGFRSLPPDVVVPTDNNGNAVTTWTKNSGINGNANLDGPGTINSGITITFTKLAGILYNTSVGSEATATPAAFFSWGSFDGSTNAPIVYPSGTSIRDLERQILGY